MGREIEFRAWDKKKKWMDDDFYLHSDGRAFDRASRTYDTPNLEIERTDDLVIMQFTGLRDKNGVKIFEGDILNYYRSDKSLNFTGKIMHSLDHSQALNRNQDRNISDEDEGFLSTYGLVCNKNYFMALCHYCRPYEYMEVIGNIHQHPHLLEE